MVCSVCLKYLWKVKDKRESSNLENCLQEMNSSLQKKGGKDLTQDLRDICDLLVGPSPV